MRALALLLLTLLPLLSTAGSFADLKIHDRTTGRTLPIHEYQGRLYVAGEPRHRYELRLRNHSGSRILAVTSVDGVNVISGETAGENQSGYVIGAHDSLAIEGWRKSLDDVATFYFTTLRDSYAARTGRPDNVGVIGIALFRERHRCCEYLHEQRGAAAPPAEASADPESSVAAGAARRDRAESKLGTGHGERESSPAQFVDFRRASQQPDETIVIYYDSRRNLVAQGVIPARSQLAERYPRPFPEGFVRDP